MEELQPALEHTWVWNYLSNADVRFTAVLHSFFPEDSSFCEISGTRPSQGLRGQTGHVTKCDRSFGLIQS